MINPADRWVLAGRLDASAAQKVKVVVRQLLETQYEAWKIIRLWDRCERRPESSADRHGGHGRPQ